MPVASLAEAWIETVSAAKTVAVRSGRLPRGGVDRNLRRRSQSRWPQVASLAEAWIETGRGRLSGAPSRGRLPRGGVDRNGICAARSSAVARSPPSRRRGSKLCAGHRHDPPLGRLPRGGVDRNLVNELVSAAPWESPPSRRRGSKLVYPSPSRGGYASPPSRRRGSKRSWRISRAGNGRSPPSRRRGSKQTAGLHRDARILVASLAEAWIETTTRSIKPGSARCRLSRGGVDRNVPAIAKSLKLSRRNKSHVCPRRVRRRIICGTRSDASQRRDPASLSPDRNTKQARLAEYCREKRFYRTAMDQGSIP